MTISVPEYFLAYILIKYVAVELGWFPSLASVSSDTPFLERLYYHFPADAYACPRHRRSYDADDARLGAFRDGEPIYRDGDPQGLAKSRIVVRHALPNALAPIISVIALNLAYLIVGVVVVETVFVYPGLGQLMVDEVSKHDVPVVQACGLIFAATFILLNMTADILAILSQPTTSASALTRWRACRSEEVDCDFFGHKLSVTAQIGLAIVFVNLFIAAVRSADRALRSGDAVGDAWADPDAAALAGASTISAATCSAG